MGLCDWGGWLYSFFLNISELRSSEDSGRCKRTFVDEGIGRPASCQDVGDGGLYAVPFPLQALTLHLPTLPFGWSGDRWVKWTYAVGAPGDIVFFNKHPWVQARRHWEGGSDRWGPSMTVVYTTRTTWLPPIPKGMTMPFVR